MITRPLTHINSSLCVNCLCHLFALSSSNLGGNLQPFCSSVTNYLVTYNMNLPPSPNKKLNTRNYTFILIHSFILSLELLKLLCDRWTKLSVFKKHSNDL